MKLTHTFNNIQLSHKDVLQLRLKKIDKNYSWLARKLRVNGAYVSQFFNHDYYPYLENKIIRIIEREENKLNVQN